MNKYILNFFGFARSCIQFFQILTVFFLLIHLLYWIEHLIKGTWGWINFFKPVLDSFIYIGSLFSQKSFVLLGAVFEYKYGIAVLCYIALYCLGKLLIKSVNLCEEFYNKGIAFVKKTEEKAFNIQLEASHNIEQKKIKHYKIFVSAIPKQFKFSAPVNINEQNTIMNKFLISKTGGNPVKFENGFLYSYNNFEYIDDVLAAFFKLIKSDAPLNYIICVQIFGENPQREEKQLKKLISLNFENKICTMADTIWRYKHNDKHEYKISQMGIYQGLNGTFETYEYVDCKDF